MATYDNTRVIAIILKNAAEKLYAEIAAVYGVVTTWILNDDDLSLPAEGDVKALVNQYLTIAPDRLKINTSLDDVLSSTEPASPGTFALPANAVPITFTASGPIPLLEILGRQGVSASLDIFRISLFVGSVDAGDDFQFDILLNDVSILAAPLTIAADTQQQVLITADVLISTLSPGDILSYQALAGSARDASSTLWVTSNE